MPKAHQAVRPKRDHKESANTRAGTAASMTMSRRGIGCDGVSPGRESERCRASIRPLAEAKKRPATATTSAHLASARAARRVRVLELPMNDRALARRAARRVECVDERPREVKAHAPVVADRTKAMYSSER